jgi:hypothetical protein
MRVVAYSSELNRSFLLPIAEVAGKRGIHLRLEPARNRQAKGVRWAEDYSLERMIGRLRNGQTAPLLDEGQLNSPEQISGL